MKASRSSFADFVENVAVVMLVALVELFLKANTSLARVPELVVGVTVKVAVLVVPVG